MERRKVALALVISLVLLLAGSLFSISHAASFAQGETRMSLGAAIIALVCQPWLYGALPASDRRYVSRLGNGATCRRHDCWREHQRALSGLDFRWWLAAR